MSRRPLLALSILLAGCATMIRGAGGTPRADLDALVGKPVSDVVVRWGAPNRTAPLPDSTTVYSWDGTGTTNTAYAANAAGGVDARSRSTQCVKSLVVSPKGTVVRWTANGDCSIY